MSVDIRMHGDAADDELRSLYEWLLNEPEIRHHADPKLVAKKPESGEMGAAFDVISLVTTSAIGLPATIEVIRGWHATRRRKPQMTIERGDLKVTFTDTDPETIIKILNSTNGT
ncbi:hypothetical protein [Actinomadura sp. 6K520]|jgi:hypothetical protein|uniref:effector-associated constant component EACC1 n=1 Tax=Actinomadura sp. 6K520 TaxID=2530364 RepID=UPI0010533C02|nr:hypothetical protein [Actinomadura sp. 6K520]TDE25130.1 hypothetical protein E1289_26990 [Actinomadura sp. 6K520]